jgi:phosphopantetheinyl transferase (holo-ACP synthase)
MRADEDFMTGHGQKLSRQHEVFIATLLTTPTVKQAAKAAGIAEATAGRWMKDPGFKAAYAEARRQALQEVIALLQKAMLGAVAVLQTKMLAKDSPPWLQVQCARDILTLGLRSWELYDQEERMATLEQMVQRYAEQ